MSQEEGQAIEQPKTMSESVAEARAILDREDVQPEPVAQEQTPEPVETTETPEPVQEVKEEPKPSIEIDPDEPLFEVEEVKEGGEKVVQKRSLNDLKKERMMQADYTRKTQELAAQRKAIPEEAKKMAAPVLQNAEQALMLANQVVMELVAPELAGMTPQKMAELSQNDPAEFARLLGKQNLVASQMQQIAMRQRQIADMKNQERLKELAESVQQSVEIISKEIPDWSQDKYASLLKTGSEYGFKPDELGQVASVADLKPVHFTDHRLVKLLADAQKYHELQKAKPNLDKKVTVVPKVMKPGTSEKPDPKAEAFEKTVAKLKKTGRDEDAHALAKYLV